MIERSQARGGNKGVSGSGHVEKDWNLFGFTIAKKVQIGKIIGCWSLKYTVVSIVNES